jgi:hypothetical protein
MDWEGACRFRGDEELLAEGGVDEGGRELWGCRREESPQLIPPLVGGRVVLDEREPLGAVAEAVTEGTLPEDRSDASSFV